MKSKCKSFCLLLVFYLAILSVSCGANPEEKLIGEWKGTNNEGQTAVFSFYKDHSAKLILGETVINKESVDCKLTWRINAKYYPMHLDYVIKCKSSKDDIMPMIFRFLSDKKIQIGVGHYSRPIHFSDKDDGNQITLIKQ